MKETLDKDQVFGLKNELIQGHAMIVLGDMLEADGDLTFSEAVQSLKRLLWDEAYPKESLRKAELIDESIGEMAMAGLMMDLPLLREEYTNEDGTPVTLEDYVNDYGYISDEAGKWIKKLYKEND